MFVRSFCDDVKEKKKPGVKVRFVVREESFRSGFPLRVIRWIEKRVSSDCVANRVRAVDGRHVDDEEV